MEVVGATERASSRSAASTTVTARPAAAGHRGRLQPDETAADHDHVPRGAQPFAQLPRVGEVTQVQHAVELGAGRGEPARAGPDGQGQPVEAQPAAAVGHGRAGAGVGHDHVLTGAQG